MSANKTTNRADKELPKAGGYPGTWTGRFIWDGGLFNIPRHYFLRLRRSFELETEVENGLIHITAADKYMLYVNGEYVGCGPARSVGAHWTSYDTHDISSKLVKGNNVIAVLAYYYGIPNAYSKDQRPGFWAQLETSNSSGEKEVLGTDALWKVKHAEGYRRDVDVVCYHHGKSVELYDANKDDPEWMNVDYNDSSWDQAYVISHANRGASWSYLEPRATPQLRERRINPAKVIKTGEACELPQGGKIIALKDVQVPERLTVEAHYPLEHATIENADSLLGQGNDAACFKSSPYSTFVNGDGVRDPFVILDFGRAFFGSPRIEFDAPEGTVVELSWTNKLKNGRIQCLQDNCRNGAAYVAREGHQVWQMFEAYAFQYLQVVFRNSPTLPYDSCPKLYEDFQKKNDHSIRVDSIDVISYEYPAEVKGRFECSDSTLTKLWKAGVDTVYMHMEDTIVVDGERERLLYILVGEIEQTHMIIYAGYGDLPITDNHFRQTTRMQLSSGQFPLQMHAISPQGFSDTKLPWGSDNPGNIPNYTPFYAQAVANRYRHTGRMDFLEEHYPALVKLAGWCSNQEDENGLLYNLSGWQWFDWVENELNGANFETNANYCKMLQDMSEMAKWLEQPRDAKKWAARAKRVAASLRDSHWNPTAGLFAASVIDGKQVELFTELANTFALSYGIATEEQSRQIVQRLTDLNYKETIETTCVATFRGLYLQKQIAVPPVNITCASPLYIYYVLRGLTAAGKGDFAVEYLSRRFKTMMDVDVPSLCEVWPMDGRTKGSSALHTGCGGVIWFLSTEVLGISIQELAFGRCRIEPKCAHLEWAKGILPSPKGEIAVSWEKRQGLFTMSVNVPDGIETEVVFPVESENVKEFVHNGKTYSVPELNISKNKISFKIQGGEHHFELS